MDSCKLILHLVCETNNTNQGQLSTEKCFFYFRSGTTFDKSHKHYVDANTKENTITNTDQKTIQLYCVFWCKIRKHQIKMYFLLRNAQIFQNQILSFETSKMGGPESNMLPRLNCRNGHLPSNSNLNPILFHTLLDLQFVHFHSNSKFYMKCCLDFNWFCSWTGWFNF